MVQIVVNAALTGLAGMKFNTSDAIKKAMPVMYEMRLSARNAWWMGTLCVFMNDSLCCLQKKDENNLERICNKTRARNGI